MDQATRALNDQLSSFWLGRASDQGLARSIAIEALSWEPTSLIVAARALEVLELAALHPNLRHQEERLRARVGVLVRRSRQLDNLGDSGTAPEALFQILGDEAEGVDLTNFSPEGLRVARQRGRNRVEAGWLFLQALGLERLPAAVVDDFRTVADDMTYRSSHFRSQALFVEPSGQRALVLGLNLGANQSGVIRPHVEADPEMQHQATKALGRALGEGQGADWDIEWPLQYEGASIGLGLYVAGLVYRNVLSSDPLLAATGQIEVDGSVTGVAGILVKLEAARRAGIRRVLMSEDNRDDAEQYRQLGELQPVFVSHLGEVAAQLRQASANTELGFDGRVGYIKSLILAPDSGIQLVDERSIQGGYQFQVANGRGRAFVNAYSGPIGAITSGGPPGTAREAVERLVAKLQSSKPQPRAQQRFHVPPGHRRGTLEDLLRRAGAIDLKAGPSELWRLSLERLGSQATVVLYSTGTLMLLNGQAPAYDEVKGLIEQALEGILPPPESTGEPKLSSNQTVSRVVDEKELHIGTDEAGKGDYFGPLVSAAVFVDSGLASRLRSMGVRDSKSLTDSTVRRLAQEIRAIAPKQSKVTKINPKSFNELYQKFRSEGQNLNQLLAWGHVRSIQDLIKRGLRPKFVVVDQFADRRYIEQRLRETARRAEMEIIQHPRAEADIAVAAASVLARDGFLDWIDQQSARLGWRIPKGASAAVIEAARRLVAEQGEQALSDYVKLNFRSTAAVLAH